MGKIIVTRAQGGLNRRKPGTDHISGLLFYSDTLPTGFGINDRVKECVQLEDAEALGITADAASVITRIMHYHVSEFFRMAPGAKLWIGIYAVPVGAHTFADITTMRDFAGGAINQIGVWTSKTFLLADITVMQGVLLDAQTANKPMCALYAANVAAVVTGSFADTRALVAPNVTHVIAQDGAALGAALYTEATYSITALGAALGTLATAKVNECIGWVEKYPLNIGTIELDVPALANGTLMKTLTDTVIEGLNTKGLLVLEKYGTAGTYFYGSPTAVALDSDYAFIELTRTMNKMHRVTREKLIPAINSSILKDAETGFLLDEAVTALEQKAGKGIEQMEKDKEVSGYRVVIDPEQDISTDTLEVVIKAVDVPVARAFNVKIGYTTKLN